VTDQDTGLPAEAAEAVPPAPPRHLTGVLFDMDGLLVDTEPVWMRAEEAVVASLGGTSWTQDDQRAILGLALPLAAEYMCSRTGSARPADEVADLIVSGFLRELADSPVPLQPGAAEIVREVSAAGVPFALVSASVRSIVDLITAHLRAADVPAFPITLAGDEVEHGKPDPTPYLRAAELLGIDIEGAVVLEDSRNGVLAGWSAGATVVAVEGMVQHTPRPRVHVRPSLRGIDLATLRGLVAGSAAAAPAAPDPE